MKLVISILLCYTIASAIAADEHRAKMKLKDAERGKRNLEYSISHNYPIGSNFRLERRIASGPSYQLPSRFPPYFPPGPRPYIPNGKRGRPHSVPAPPYAVQMEPLVQYSQRDPLYDTSKIPLTAEGHNELSKPDDLLTDNNHLSENIYAQNIHGPSYSHHPHHEPVYYQKEPEPIIEIIIKESNVTLPPVPVPTVQPKKKEPVQVFYVKYKKNPNGHGKDSVIYDKPVPALTPHVDESDEPQLDHPIQEYVTAAPPPSTTIRTIIRPDSETYIGTSGIRVTFGSEHKKEKPSLEGHEESAPQPAVIFPQNNHHHHHHQQPQGQFSQPIPERKPPTSAFPPNFNPPTNFNQQSFNPRPPSHFQNNQYRPLHQQQSVRQFPNQQNQRPPGPPPHRQFQSQQFPPRPLNAPQLPSQHQHRPQFNPPPQFPPTHQQFPPNHQPSLQFPQNHQFPQSSFPPNHQFSQNLQFPTTQFTSHSFQHNFPPPPPPPKPQFSQLLNHRPQTHFPVIQPQLPQISPPQQFNQKPQPQKQPQNIQFNQNPNQQQLRNNQQPQHQQQQQHQKQQQQHQQQQQQQQHQQQQQQQQHQQQQSFQFHHQLNNQHQQQINHPQQQFNNQQQLNHHPQHQPQQPQQLGHIIPPGGELLKSVPRYEQHISIPAESSNTQLNNNQGIKSQALPQTQNQPQNNHFANAQAATQSIQFNHQLQAQSLQLQQQLQHEQQQRNLQIQQQLKQQDQLLQQKNLSPQEFQQQIQHQFQQFPQNFAQLNLAQNKQSQQQSEIKSAQKQENIHIQQSQQPQQQQQQQNSQAQNFFLQNLQNQQKSIQAFYQPQQNNPSSAVPSSTTQKIFYQSTTQKPSSSTSKTEEKTEDKKKEHKLPANIVLPDEVPDDLREQLLSSGILSNADISVLDYDKVGDIPIDALPPDQLANFYGAGGAQQLAASERKETYVKQNGEPVEADNSKTIFDQELEAEASEIDEVTESTKTKPAVEMKVVHYDSETKEGKAVQDSYVRDDATQVDPVVLNDNKYNRYLPLKVSGVNFPIPEVPELKGRNITSVVVLAPVDYEFQPHEHHSERPVRDIEGDIKDVRLLAGEALKDLIKEPTKENYNKWLERENQTASDKQSVVLLVTGSPDSKEKEIFMYDVGTKTVSKLSGELSSAFVEAAESNAEDEALPSPSEVYETRIKLENTPSDLEAENSEILEEFVDLSDNSETADNRILVKTGYRKTG